MNLPIPIVEDKFYYSDAQKSKYYLLASIFLLFSNKVIIVHFDNKYIAIMFYILYLINIVYVGIASIIGLVTPMFSLEKHLKIINKYGQHFTNN